MYVKRTFNKNVDYPRRFKNNSAIKGVKKRKQKNKTSEQ